MPRVNPSLDADDGPHPDDDGEEEEEAERELEVEMDEAEEAEEEEEEEEEEAGEADVPLAKITKADHLENIVRFVVGVFLRRGGQMQFQIVTKGNHEKLASEKKSAWSAYTAFFLMPTDKDLGPALRRFSDQLKLSRHHEADCFTHCGCKLGGMNFVKQLGFEDDQRKLAALFQPGTGRKLLLAQHRPKSADQLARELAAQMAALQKANQAGCKPVGASKRPREGADPGRPGGAARTGGDARTYGARGAAGGRSAAAGPSAEPAGEDEERPQELRDALRTSNLAEVGRVFELMNAFLPTIDEAQRVPAKQCFDQMRQNLSAAYMSESAPTSLSPTTIKTMQVLSILGKNRGLAGKLRDELAQKQRDKENTAPGRQIDFDDATAGG